MVKTALAKLLTLKVAAAATAAVAAAGGVAYAASTGSIPGLSGNSHIGAVAAASAAPGSDSSHGPGDAKGSPSPSLVGLCHAYTAGVSSSQGKALENPAFTALITAAGGKDKVAAFCATTLASAAPNKGNSSDASSARPATVPSHPDGRPSDHPSGAPSTHPTR